MRPPPCGLPFGAETVHAPWNQLDGLDVPRCAYCGEEAEREYPDQSDADIVLPCSDAERNSFCSRECALEYALTVRTRRKKLRGGRGSCDLRRDLSELYQAASRLARLDDEVVQVVTTSDDGYGMLRTGSDAERGGTAERSSFVDLPGLRDAAHELCKLLGGAEDDPGWLCGDYESDKTERWLEGLVEFRMQHFANEVWPRARDLSRMHIAALHGFHAKQGAREAERRENESAPTRSARLAGG